MGDIAVWKAISGSGETCAFGVESLARIWAKNGGSVERLEFQPHIERPAAPAVDLTELESLMLRNHTHKRRSVVEGWPDAHTVWLRVGVQSFCVTPHCCETANDAEWTRTMLAKALAALVRLAQSGMAPE